MKKMKPFNITLFFVLMTWAGLSLALVNFSPSQNTDVGDDRPRAVAVGDVNGDGALDLVTANTGENINDEGNDTFSVLLNDGNAVFSLFGGAKQLQGNQPRWVTLRDLDGDGDLDLVVVNFGQNTSTVLILTNDGNGNFIQQPNPNNPYAVGVTPTSAAVEDFDGDGDQDIVVTNGGTNDLSVLLNQTQQGAPAVFSVSPNRIPAGIRPVVVTSGDIDGDGGLDLVVANLESDNVFLYHGNGDATFSTLGGPLTVGTAPRSVTLGDVNIDGNLDIITANEDSNDVSVLLGNGDGTFSAKVDYATGTKPHSIAVRDVDNDGNLDLVCANSGDDTVSVLLGNNEGNFQNAAKTFDVEPGRQTPTVPHFVVAANLDGDNKPDVVTVGSESDTVSVLLNRSTPNEDPITTDDRYAFNTPSLTVSAEEGVLSNDIDADSDTLTASLDTDVQNGTLSLQGDGSFTYTPNSGFTGMDTFTYIATDASEGSAPGQVELTVTQANTNVPEVLTNGITVITMTVGAQLRLPFDVIDADAGDTHTFNVRLADGGVVATASFEGVELVLNGMAAGQDRLLISVTDSSGLTSSDVQIPLTVITGSGNNSAPVASNGTLSVSGTESTSGRLSANDVDNDRLIFSIVTQPTMGRVVITNAATGDYTYTANASVSATDTFVFRVNDGTTSSDNATVTVTLSASSSGGKKEDSGGCSLRTHDAHAIDPLLPILLMGSLIYLIGTRKRAHSVSRSRIG